MPPVHAYLHPLNALVKPLLEYLGIAHHTDAGINSGIFCCGDYLLYGALYVGMLWIFRTTNTTHHPEIIFSRDGYRFERRYREPFIPRGAPADSDCTSIYVTVNMVHKGTLYTYYIGTNHRSPEQLADLGDKAVEGVGLAITPADGFVSLDGVKGVPLNYSPAPEEIAPYSEMVTRAFSFSHGHTPPGSVMLSLVRQTTAE